MKLFLIFTYLLLNLFNITTSKAYEHVEVPITENLDLNVRISNLQFVSTTSSLSSELFDRSLNVVKDTINSYASNNEGGLVKPSSMSYLTLFSNIQSVRRAQLFNIVEYFFTSPALVVLIILSLIAFAFVFGMIISHRLYKSQINYPKSPSHVQLSNRKDKSLTFKEVDANPETKEAILSNPLSTSNFGKPEVYGNLNEENDSQKLPQPLSTVDLHVATAAILRPYKYKSDKDQDVIEVLSAQQGTFLAVVLADGASEYRYGPEGDEYANGGRKAAEIATKTTIDILSRKLTRSRLKSTDIIKTIQEVYLAVSNDIYKYNNNALQNANEPGGTTLLIGMLVNDGNNIYWYYSYIGNGQIVLMSPSRMIGQFLSEANLLTPQEGGGGGTVLLPYATGTSFEPIIGIIPYQIGDCLFVATDGMNAIGKYLNMHMGLTLANYIWKNLRDQKSSLIPEIPNFLTDPNIPKKALTIEQAVRDDATLALIWTQGKP